MSAIKSVLLKGNFKQNSLSYSLCPPTEFCSGAWNLSINAVSYVCLDENYHSHCSLSCNFVRTQKLATNGTGTMTYQLPLMLFSIQSGLHTISSGN